MAAMDITLPELQPELQASLTASINKLSTGRKTDDTSITAITKTIKDTEDDMAKAVKDNEADLKVYGAKKEDLSSTISSITNALKTLKASKPSLMQLKSASGTVREAMAMADALGLGIDSMTGPTATWLQPDAPEVEMENYKFHAGGVIETLEKLLDTFRGKKIKSDAEEEDLSSTISSITNALKTLKASKPSLMQLKSASGTVREAMAMADALGLGVDSMTGPTATLLQEDAPEVEMENYKFHAVGVIETLEKLLDTFRGKKTKADAEEVSKSCNWSQSAASIDGLMEQVAEASASIMRCEAQQAAAFLAAAADLSCPATRKCILAAAALEASRARSRAVANWVLSESKEYCDAKECLATLVKANLQDSPKGREKLLEVLEQDVSKSLGWGELVFDDPEKVAVLLEEVGGESNHIIPDDEECEKGLEQARKWLEKLLEQRQKEEVIQGLSSAPVQGLYSSEQFSDEHDASEGIECNVLDALDETDILPVGAEDLLMAILEVRSWFRFCGGCRDGCLRRMPAMPVMPAETETGACFRMPGKRKAFADEKQEEQTVQQKRNRVRAVLDHSPDVKSDSKKDDTGSSMPTAPAAPAQGSPEDLPAQKMLGMQNGQSMTSADPCEVRKACAAIIENPSGDIGGAAEGTPAPHATRTASESRESVSPVDLSVHRSSLAGAWQPPTEIPGEQPDASSSAHSWPAGVDVSIVDASSQGTENMQVKYEPERRPEPEIAPGSPGKQEAESPLSPLDLSPGGTGSLAAEDEPDDQSCSHEVVEAVATEETPPEMPLLPMRLDRLHQAAHVEEPLLTTLQPSISVAAQPKPAAANPMPPASWNANGRLGKDARTASKVSPQASMLPPKATASDLSKGAPALCVDEDGEEPTLTELPPSMTNTSLPVSGQVEKDVTTLSAQDTFAGSSVDPKPSPTPAPLPTVGDLQRKSEERQESGVKRAQPEPEQQQKGNKKMKASGDKGSRLATPRSQRKRSLSVPLSSSINRQARRRRVADGCPNPVGTNVRWLEATKKSSAQDKTHRASMTKLSSTVAEDEATIQGLEKELVPLGEMHKEVDKLPPVNANLTAQNTKVRPKLADRFFSPEPER